MRYPKCDWKLKDGNGFACFLSHYKVENGAVARYLKDSLDQMLGCPSFLDSSNLADLRLLCGHCLARSDCLVMLATDSYLRRPWCLIELWMAARLGLPIVVVEIAPAGFDWSAADYTLRHLDSLLAEGDAALLEDEVGTTGDTTPQGSRDRGGGGGGGGGGD